MSQSPPPPAKKPPVVDAKAPAAPGSKAPTAPGSDVVVVHGRTDDQRGYKVIRAREERIELGEVRPVEEGKPLAGDLVTLLPREGAPNVYDVRTEVKLPAAPQKSHPGPARVTTEAYRENWDAIWSGAKSPKGKPNSSLN